MKHLWVLLAGLWCMLLPADAQKQLELKDITGGKFYPEAISGIHSIEGTADYARIGTDRKSIEQYSYQTGKLRKVLFTLDGQKDTLLRTIDGYLISPDGKYVLIQTNTERIYRRSFRADYFLYDTKSHSLTSITRDGKAEIPQFSPDGKKIALVRDNNIFVLTTEQPEVLHQITYDGQQNAIINGKPDWVYEEEFGFNSAMSFDASGKYISWIHFNETDVPTYGLQLYQGERPRLEQNRLYPSLYSYKYPKAGERNSEVKVFAANLEENTVCEINVPVPAEGYIPRLKASAADAEVFVYTLNRHQDSLQLHRADLNSGVVNTVLTEAAACYVKEEAIEDIIIGRQTILLPSDRDGFMHLYIYDYNGTLLRKIDTGEHDITAVYGYDEAAGDVYFQAALPDACNRQVLVGHKNGTIQRLTPLEGWNSATFSADYRHFVCQWSNADTPPVFTLMNNKGKVVRELLRNDALQEKLAPYGLPKKRFFTVEASNGERLNGWMVVPCHFNEAERYPVIMFQYSGPGSQQVVNSWNIGSMGQGALYDYYLAQHGYIVACVDGRGTGGRGAAFEKCTYLNLGKLESADQNTAAAYLASLPYVDGSRVGIWGWSYGGYNTLMSMCEGSFTFKAGVAVAPPTDWRYYDSVYTERFMRTPSENASGYDTNPIQRASALQGALLICHGTADDNVHPQNSYEYTEALVQADKDFKVMYYTNRNHSIYGGNTRNHLLRQISQWFFSNL